MRCSHLFSTDKPVDERVLCKNSEDGVSVESCPTEHYGSQSKGKKFLRSRSVLGTDPSPQKYLTNPPTTTATVKMVL